MPRKPRSPKRPQGPPYEFVPRAERMIRADLSVLVALAFAALPEFGPNWMVVSEDTQALQPSGIAFARVRESPDWPLCKPGYYTFRIVRFRSNDEVHEDIQGPFGSLEEAIAAQGVGYMQEHALRTDWIVVPFDVRAPSWLSGETPKPLLSAPAKEEG